MIRELFPAKQLPEIASSKCDSFWSGTNLFIASRGKRWRLGKSLVSQPEKMCVGDGNKGRNTYMIHFEMWWHVGIFFLNIGIQKFVLLLDLLHVELVGWKKVEMLAWFL